MCSGRGVSIDEVIQIMQELLGVKAELETDPRLVRPNDNRIVLGSNDKIRRAVGWQPNISLRTSLSRILDWWAQN